MFVKELYKRTNYLFPDYYFTEFSLYLIYVIVNVYMFPGENVNDVYGKSILKPIMPYYILIIGYL